MISFNFQNLLFHNNFEIHDTIIRKRKWSLFINILLTERYQLIIFRSPMHSHFVLLYTQTVCIMKLCWKEFQVIWVDEKLNIYSRILMIISFTKIIGKMSKGNAPPLCKFWYFKLTSKLEQNVCKKFYLFL